MTDIRQVWEAFEPPQGLVAQFVGGQIVIQASPTMLHDMIIRNVVCGNPNLWPTGILHGVAEVISPTSERMDRKIKPDVYAASGIPVYVIIDPRRGDWEVYMLGPGRSYVLAEQGPFGRPVALPLRDGRRILVETAGWHPYPSA